MGGMRYKRTLTLGSEIRKLGVPSTIHMVKTLSSLFLAFVFLSIAALAQSSEYVTQTVTIEVKPVTKIVVSGNPGPLIVGDAIPGSNLSSVDDENTKYSLTTNLENMKVVASIDQGMPDGTKLLVHLRTSKGLSLGSVDISRAYAPVDVVTGIGKSSDKDQSIKYTFAADAAVGEIPSQSRTVTLTLTN